MPDAINFPHYFSLLKEKYPKFSELKDYELFTIFCLKTYFFAESNVPFDPDIVIDYLTDGSKDGGVDAIFNDPSSNSNDMIIVQSKYYNSQEVNVHNIIEELSKINKTIKNLNENKVSDYSAKIVSQYRLTSSQLEDDAKIRVYFFTSYIPSTKKDRNKIQDEVEQYFSKFDDISLNFADDIKSEIEICESGQLFVPKDKLILDRADNFLEYDESVIVNVSAKSLQDLQNRRRNTLLGMNLRYHIKDKKVDEEILRTIRKDPANFWYKNNGVVIICGDYQIDGNVLKLTQFSIINGGQTTSMIGKTDIPDEDFYIQCKVVKPLGAIANKEEFLLSIAKATNSQKPIKISDLKANSPEQLNLKAKFSEIDFYYITKKGEKAPRNYSLPYKIATLEQIGKLSMAGILQMPGSARSNSSKMYSDDYYYHIFGSGANPQIMSDLVKLGYYYDRFLKLPTVKNHPSDIVQPILKNGKTFILACVSLLCKLNAKSVNYNEILTYLSDTDKLKITLRSNNGLASLFKNSLDNEEKIVQEIFTFIGEDILSYCFEVSKGIMSSQNKTIVPSDYLKNDSNYYKDVVKQLWSKYNSKPEFKKIFESIF
jgi:hypothetical protein